MKFLQIAADYAVSLSLSLQRQDEEPRNDGLEGDIDTDAHANSKAVVGEDMVLSLNERQLRQGRSLHRPQNKTVATLDMETLQQCIKEDMSFGTYLKKHHKLSDNMIDIIIYAMAMGSSSNEKGCEYSTKDGMRDLCKHLQSLGKYGSTAFLTPLYGSGELSQAFCRCAAVHGGTYLLRRGPTRIQLDAKGGVCGVMLPSNDNEDGQGKSEKLILAKHVVAPLQMIKQNGRKTRRVCRRVSIVRGPIVLTNTTEQDTTTNNEQRHIIIIPPGDQCLCNDYVIHGLVLDESVNIAPRSVSTDIPPITVLHLSTFENVHNEGDSSNGSGATVLRNAAKALYGKHCVELYQLTFSHDLYDQQEINVCDSPGLHVCRPSAREGTLVVDNSFVEARRVFEEICPNDTFLMLSSEMDELLKERLAGMHDDGDEEVQMLESAMSMVKASDQS
jgi:RAB proteins geranylgeranyltransferase component A (RAB escort protein)